MLFGFKILFVISLISLQKICNRPSQIHCLNSDGTGDLSLLRYKPDFVTSLFVINKLYFTSFLLETTNMFKHKLYMNGH